MTKKYAACSTETLLGIVRRDLSHAVEMMTQAGLPEEVAEQLAAKIHNIVWGVWSTYGPGSIGAEVKALVDAQAATELAGSLTETSGEKPVQGLHSPECHQ